MNGRLPYFTRVTLMIRTMDIIVVRLSAFPVKFNFFLKKIAGIKKKEYFYSPNQAISFDDGMIIAWGNITKTFINSLNQCKI